MAEAAREREADLIAREEQAQEEVERRQFILAHLGQTMEGYKRTAINYKTHVETRMLMDESQYWGSVGIRDAKSDATKDAALEHNQTPTDNKTRSKTRIAAARIGDMLFPTNSPNWAMRPTPNPEVGEDQLALAVQEALAEQQQQGAPDQPVSPPDEDQLKYEIATRACTRMSRRIQDVLAESGYPKLGRQAIMDACKLGTGIIKGPCVTGTVKRRYKPSLGENGERVDVLEVTTDKQPRVRRVSPWNFFPLPARCIEECEAVLEMHLPTATNLRQMVVSHGFDPEVTKDLLEKGPVRGEVDEILSQRANITGDNSTDYKDNWAVWEYNGPIEAEELWAWGLLDEPDADILQSLYGEVWFCDGKILRMNLSMLEADSALPYHVFNYEEDETSIFGFGIPFIMRDDQYVIDMTWDAMIYNAAVSAGPQIAITKGLLTPADGSYNVRGPKTWYNQDEDMDIRKVIQTMVIPSTIEHNMPLYEAAKANADENTNLPLMLGDSLGSTSALPASGIAMILNQQNIVQRQAAHLWDDNVTSRLIPRMYDWFMQHDPDPSIKGDFEVEVRGASYLLVKDSQAQHAQLLIQLAAQDPSLAGMLNIEELYRVYLGFMDIPVDRLIKSSEQIKREQAGQQPSPLEQLEMQEKEATIQKLQAEAAEKQQNVLSGQQPTAEKLMEMELEFAKLSVSREQSKMQMEIEAMRRDTQLLRAAADEGIAYEKISADMEKFHTKLQVDIATREAERQSDDYFKAAELRLTEYRDRLKAINLGKGFDTFS